MIATFFSHGKLLLSGEYAVLDGARALALPTRPGQWLEVSEHNGPGLGWSSRDSEGQSWLEAAFTPEQLEQPVPSGPFPITPEERLLRILQTVVALQPGFLEKCRGARVETRLDFPRAWGLGSSSTLLANLAAWSGADPYALLDRTLGGSGYDLACATSNRPIYYSRIPGEYPVTVPAPFDPPFAGSLWFVYLNVKQDSREGIARYRKKQPVPQPLLNEISNLGTSMAAATDLTAFCSALNRHETLISGLLGLPTVKESLFPDFPGSLKSLGAWGGDFILAATPDDPSGYFLEKGYPTLLAYRELMA